MVKEEISLTGSKKASQRKKKVCSLMTQKLREVSISRRKRPTMSNAAQLPKVI